ncbi:MAG: hypothetical protein EPO52_09730 [Herbiconiux sp.]|uniref:DUF3885 domain-containing protein n=1 Tax=Herbiconiux sp. TaxID=1871186 RepID=UPI0012224B0E|nr:hypothetical protein [Herbiconiux sp.]TAJ48407.1 MAG: hypothetical protein EPO52_09730 [Herbiconiux sp.]
MAKRYADNSHEWSELLARHRALLLCLTNSTTRTPLTLIACDWDPPDLGAGEAPSIIPNASFWRRARVLSDAATGEDSGADSFWVAWYPSVESLTPLLAHCAEEEADVVIVDETLSWIYHPYPGGVDVIAATGAIRDDLRGRFAHWRPLG